MNNPGRFNWIGILKVALILYGLILIGTVAMLITRNALSIYQLSDIFIR